MREDRELTFGGGTSHGGLFQPTPTMLKCASQTCLGITVLGSQKNRQNIGELLCEVLALRVPSGLLSRSVRKQNIAGLSSKEVPPLTAVI